MFTARANTAVIAYVNGKTVGEARLNRADGFREVTISIPAAALRVGENAIMLRSTKTAPTTGSLVHARNAGLFPPAGHQLRPGGPLR